MSTSNLALGEGGGGGGGGGWCWIAHKSRGQ